MTDSVVTCPECGKHGHLLAKDGTFKKHDDQARTIAAQQWGGRRERVVCAAWGCTPERAARIRHLSPPF